MTAARMPLGSLERAVMEVLWNSEGAGLTVREVIDKLTDKRLAYTTVMTVLSRLFTKGVATRRRDGRAWRYTAAQTREAMTAQAMRGPLDDLPHEDQHSAILHFIERASDSEIASLKAALAKLDDTDQ